MNSKELVDFVLEAEPHVLGPIVQDNYLEVRIVDPSNPLITHAITKVDTRFLVTEAGDRLVITLS